MLPILLKNRKACYSLYISILLVFCSCLRMPNELNHNAIADCDNPTIPDAYTERTMGIFAVLEVYDYEKRLVHYRESVDAVVPPQWSTGFDFNSPISFYWNGYDSDGNRVDDGKYLAKVSLISTSEKKCECSEVWIKNK